MHKKGKKKKLLGIELISQKEKTSKLTNVHPTTFSLPKCQ